MTIVAASGDETTLHTIVPSGLCSFVESGITEKSELTLEDLRQCSAGLLLPPMELFLQHRSIFAARSCRIQTSVLSPSIPLVTGGEKRKVDKDSSREHVCFLR
jgi:hypothetical protein